MTLNILTLSITADRCYAECCLCLVAQKAECRGDVIKCMCLDCTATEGKMKFLIMAHIKIKVDHFYGATTFSITTLCTFN
jgi:hypothetical protein